MRIDDSMFRRQFLCSRDIVHPPQGYRSLEKKGWFLHYSPDLPVEHCEDGILLGHALDWAAPEKSNAAILSDLVSTEFQATVSHTNQLAGRWALILLNEKP